MIEHSILARASAQQVFQIYAEVSKWQEWDPDTKAASLDGPFVEGSSGTLAPTKGRPIRIRLESVVPNRSFTVLGGIPGFQMRFEHELTQSQSTEGPQTEIVHRVRFSGFLSFIFKPLLGPQINRGLPETLKRLASLAEERSRA
jgi:hypothetical protein